MQNLKLEINICPSSLTPGFNNYSPQAHKQLFNGSRVNCILDYNSPQIDESVSEQFILNRKHLSISGVQAKQSLIQIRNKLKLTIDKQQGTHILKPVPYGAEFKNPEALPANENLTMQIAMQVYGIKTAANGIIFFKNGEPAFITKRFDINSEGNKVSQEDLSVIMGLSAQSFGPEFKYEGSYQHVAEVLKEYLPAYIVEIEKYFSLILFNYLFSNGDAHLKNFSLQQLPSGDHILSPAYDLVNTRLHIKYDTAMALNDGLFNDDYMTKSYEKNGFYAYDDFYEFGIKIGLIPLRLLKILDKFRTENHKVYFLVKNSFLSPDLKQKYIELYKDRIKALNYSFLKKI